MSFAAPAALWLLLLAVPVLLLHVLRPRRAGVPVSSVLLWEQDARPVSAAAPWQRLRPSLLLALQLLAVVLLAVAAARPVRLEQAPLARHTVFILDVSASMGAADGNPDRVATAVRRARALRRSVPAGGRASVVVAGPVARVVLPASTDRGAFDDALRGLRATAAPADLAGAFTLAESLETPDEPIGFVLLSDGRLTDSERRLLPPGTRYERVGSRATNRAITRLVAEPGAAGLHVVATLANTGGATAEQTLRVDVDGRTAAREQVRIPAGSTVTRELDVPLGDRVVAFLEGEDLLALDNRAYTVAAQRAAARVLLAGPGNPFLERLLAALPGVTVEQSATTRPAVGFDLAIYDRVPVPADPGAAFVAVAPPGGMPGVRVTGTAERPAVTLVRSEDRLVAGLDLSDVAVARAQRLEAAADEVVVAAEATPLVLHGVRAGRAFAYLGFALEDSDLPLRVAFPMLGDRMLTVVADTGPPPADLRTGALLPVRGPVTISHESDGRTQVVPAGAPPPVADRPGFWRLRPEAAGGEAAAAARERLVAVNVDPRESALAPERRLEVAPAPRGGAGAGTRSERPLLAAVAVALLAVVAVEAVLSRRTRAVPRRRWRLALAARVAIALLVLAALAGFAVPRRGRAVATVFAVDASASMGAAGREDAVSWVREALRSQPRSARAAVVLFGGDARVERTLQHRLRLLDPAVQIDSSRTDVAGALRLAGALLPADSRRRVVVVSDGRANAGDARLEAQRLRVAGIRVDVHAVEPRTGPDAAVAGVDAPARARRGEQVLLRVTLSATEAGPATLEIRRDGEVVDSRGVALTRGDIVVEVPVPAGDAGFTRYEVRVRAARDGVAANDVGHAAVAVESPGRVLVVEGARGDGAVLAAVLRAGGLAVDVAPAVPTIDVLAGADATVLVDVDERSLGPEQVDALTAATRDLGRGLVVVGGDRSYALGGYLDSRLERLLPVISDVTDPKRRATVAEVLAIDASGSMGACHCRDGANGLVGGGNSGEGGVNKTAISRAAAARTIDALHANDQVGILAFNTEQRWIVDLQRLPSREVVERGLRGLQPAGGTDLRAPLRTAAEALRATKARLKHIILFTDGFTAEGALDDVVGTAEALAAEGITVSVLATGETGAGPALQRVAQAGRGRYYPGRDLEEIPQIMAQEAVLASRTIVNEGEFLPRVTSTSPVVRSLTAAPPLLGYLATTAKPRAEVLLGIGPDDDPLLATWQVGVGRATAWTSDASARWSQHWATWDGFVGFWSGVVKDTFLAAGGSGAVARARVEGDRLRITVESEQPWPAGATATARVATPAGGPGSELALERVSGSAFAGDVPAAAAGSYGAGVEVVSDGSRLFAGTVVAQQGYSPEYRPGSAQPASLAAVSSASGGRGAIAPGDAFDPAGLPPGDARIPLAGWLLLAAALLWPVAVALARLAPGTAGAVAGAAAAARRRVPPVRRPPGRPAAPAEPARTGQPGAEGGGTVERLLERKRRDRAR